MLTLLLLFCSNVFMNFAWYGHIQFNSAPLIVAILVSWAIALPEYALAVPANRFGHATEGVEAATSLWWWGLSRPQLKIVQEIVSIGVFLGINFLFWKERVRPTDWIAIGLIIAAVVIAMLPRAMQSQQRNTALSEAQQRATESEHNN